MARPVKQGIDYFPLGVGFLQDIKIRRIMRACGRESISVIISLLSNIYRNDGYYLLWDKDMPFIIADEIDVSEDTVTSVVEKSIEVGFFSEDVFKQYNVLTSPGIQQRFFTAISRRNEIKCKKHLLKVDVSSYSNVVIVDADSESVDDNSINSHQSTQSKVKESKGKNTNKRDIS